jgi:hypothetical protein
MGTPEHRRGFGKADSTVSLTFPNCYTQVGAHGADDRGILHALIHGIPPGKTVTCILFVPLHAQVLANNGWSKQKIKAFVSEYARVPLYQHSSYFSQSDTIEGSNKKSLPPNPQDTVPIIPNPESIWIVVAGGTGGTMGITRGAPRIDLGGYFVNLVTKKVKLPKHWEKLVEKYKSIAPNYALY